MRRHSLCSNQTTSTIPGTATKPWELHWTTLSIFWNDPQTKQSDDKVGWNLHLNEMLEKLPDGFKNTAAVTRSHIEAANVPAHIQKIIVKLMLHREQRGDDP
jgi:hypothetical protein